MPTSLTIRTEIDGTPHPREAVLAWELDRARAALHLLKQRLGDTRTRELLTPDTTAADTALTTWAQASAGRWRTAVTELTATGIDARTFLTWWQTRLHSGDRTALLAANPEHYLADSTGDRVEIIETLGTTPTRFFLHFHDTPGNTTFPVRIGGTGTLADGTEVLHVMHEFADTPDGLRIRLTVQFPEAAPDLLPIGHQWHFACEFTNWLQAAHAA
ncbi:hypothetical protein DR950_25225 [Kitasatospora xanthocidica]|uniref:Uncharacterized protein n=1 Tax=Kitasatospora xanthocidica TaxID=83382 RepID=A0A372ZXX6_9ACTN|nr:hypothetical protein [Kitasatospora xanthocidica]RGD60631.1 hypothetical protein DR950_25225 [Kitasatospora xanthocidica]